MSVRLRIIAALNAAFPLTVGDFVRAYENVPA
jgi:hypothetical protein